MSALPAPARVVAWSTGGVGTAVIDAIGRRPDMKLVGVWVHSPDKVGKDAGELAGGGPIGLKATNDADALIALTPDCVVYSASGPERDAAVTASCTRCGPSPSHAWSTSSATKAAVGAPGTGN